MAEGRLLKCFIFATIFAIYFPLFEFSFNKKINFEIFYFWFAAPLWHFACVFHFFYLLFFKLFCLSTICIPFFYSQALYFGKSARKYGFMIDLFGGFVDAGGY